MHKFLNLNEFIISRTLENYLLYCKLNMFVFFFFPFHVIRKITCFTKLKLNIRTSSIILKL